MIDSLLGGGLVKHTGIYRGKVVNNLDPRMLARVTVHVPEIHGVDEDTGERPESGWAWPRVSGPITKIPKIGTDVWVQFEGGDVERPIWEIAPFTLTDGESSADNHIKGKYDLRDNQSGRLTSMPSSIGTPEYASTEIWKGDAGVIEIEKNTIRIQHKSGGRIEFLPDGSIEIYASGNIRQVFNGAMYEEVHTKCVQDYQDLHQNTSGICKLIHSGDKEEACSGSYSLTTGAQSHTINGPCIRRVLGHDSEVLSNGKSKLVIGNESAQVTGNYSIDVVGELGKESIRLQSIIGAIELLQGQLPGAKQRIHMDNTGISVEATLSLVLSALTSILLEAPIVRVGNGASQGVCKSSFLSLFELHTHLSAPPGSPTTPPVGVVPGSLLLPYSTTNLLV